MRILNLFLLLTLLQGTLAAESGELLDEPGRIPRAAEREFSTDFSRSTVPFDSIISGGPPKDGIPAIDSPSFLSPQEADKWIEDSEPVLLLRYRGAVRVYPLQILMFHEIVNDRIDGRSVAVTYCPLCNTGIAFHGEIDGRELDFGTTGRLRYSNLIMYDRQSETWWQQASGEGIVGQYAGRSLELLPVTLLSWGEILEQRGRGFYEQARVLSRDTGYSKPYGTNPYRGYDSRKSPFLYRGPEIDESQQPMERVLSVQIDSEEKSYTYSRLQDEKVVHDTLAGREIVLFWQPGTSSALDESKISEGNDVGSVGAYFPRAAGETLDFYYDGSNIRDRSTGSVWSISGIATDGELEGTQLDSPVAVNHFWFSWNAFRK